MAVVTMGALTYSVSVELITVSPRGSEREIHDSVGDYCITDCFQRGSERSHLYSEHLLISQTFLCEYINCLEPLEFE